MTGTGPFLFHFCLQVIISMILLDSPKSSFQYYFLKSRGLFDYLCEQSNLALALDAVVHIELPPNQHSSDLLRPGSHTVQSRIAEETPSRIIYGMTRLATEKKMQPNEQRPTVDISISA